MREKPEWLDEESVELVSWLGGGLVVLACMVLASALWWLA